jgi:hypothetical protein
LSSVALCGEADGAVWVDCLDPLDAVPHKVGGRRGRSSPALLPALAGLWALLARLGPLANLRIADAVLAVPRARVSKNVLSILVLHQRAEYRQARRIAEVCSRRRRNMSRCNGKNVGAFQRGVLVVHVEAHVIDFNFLPVGIARIRAP